MSSTASDTNSDTGPVIIPPTPTTSISNSNIDITAQPAIITWRDFHGEDQCLSRLTLDVHYHYDVGSSKAFFKLRAAVALKSQPRSRTTAVFLFIHPERIRGLVLDDSPCTAEARMLGPETVALHFELSRLPVLVVPNEPLAPRNQTSGNLLDSLRAAVQQATFCVYVNIPRRRLPLQRLLALCGAVSRNELRSLVAHSNASSLYAGAGGKIIEGDSFCRLDSSTTISGEHESAIEPLVENPPSYDDVPPGPPPAVVPGPHKRRRLSTPGTEVKSMLPERLDRKYIEDICTHMIDNRLAQLRCDVAKQLQDLENRVIDYVDEQLILQRQEAKEDLGLQAEDEYYGLKLDLEDYVREEIEEAEGRILDHLSTASFSLQLNP
ncbi:hypothetical protein F5Y09DRAFT_72027 [Xylaria sp. FL1042]|nr:hypothetical protein F5Y09DRAFT_72027 [Xylaria sp. FL1042]